MRRRAIRSPAAGSGTLSELIILPVLDNAYSQYAFVTLVGRAEAPVVTLLRNFARKQLRE